LQPGQIRLAGAAYEKHGMKLGAIRAIHHRLKDSNGFVVGQLMQGLREEFRFDGVG
jgi:hypothetical protein